MADDNNTNYEKEIYGTSIFKDSNTITCNDANILVYGSSKATYAAINCNGKLTATTKQTSTTTISDIKTKEEATVACGFKGEMFGSTTNLGVVHCKDMKITITASSTVNIIALFCTGTLELSISSSSTLIIDGGEIGMAKGSLIDSSKGICKASIGRDDVEVRSSSTWKA